MKTAMMMMELRMSRASIGQPLIKTQGMSWMNHTVLPVSVVGSAKELTGAQRKKFVAWYMQDDKYKMELGMAILYDKQLYVMKFNLMQTRFFSYYYGY